MEDGGGTLGFRAEQSRLCTTAADRSSAHRGTRAAKDAASMNIGVYQGAASLAALERWQGIISENLAAQSVPGFRKSEATFASVLGGELRGGGERSAAASRSVMPSAVSRINMQPGQLRTTGAEFDFAIEGPGFFQIQRPDGQTGFTRDGEFHVNAERTVVNKLGYPLLGDGGPIVLRPEGGRISVNADGAIVQGDQVVGRISLVDFADPSKLRRIGDGLLATGDGTRPDPIERPKVVTGALEGSNVVGLQEMVNLITVSRAYQASQRVIQTADENAGKAIQSLGNPLA
jgi:flagellar basal body rod protein FlgG